MPFNKAIQITDWLTDGQIPVHTNEDREPISAGSNYDEYRPHADLNVRPHHLPIQVITVNI